MYSDRRLAHHSSTPCGLLTIELPPHEFAIALTIVVSSNAHSAEPMLLSQTGLEGVHIASGYRPRVDVSLSDRKCSTQ